MLCSLCHKALEPMNAWKGTADRFYCSEFCADSETVIPAAQHAQKLQIDRQYIERLERLLPLRKSLRD